MTLILAPLCPNYLTAAWSPLSADRLQLKQLTQPRVFCNKSSLVMSPLLTYIYLHTMTPFIAVAWPNPFSNHSSPLPTPPPIIAGDVNCVFLPSDTEAFFQQKVFPYLSRLWITISMKMHSYNFTQPTRRLSPFIAVDLLLNAWTEPTYPNT